MRPYSKLLICMFAVGLLFLILGCGNSKSSENSPITKLELENKDHLETIARLKTELEHEKNKPVVIKYVDNIVEKEVESMTSFKILGMWIMCLSVGASVILHFLVPSMWYFGLAGAATGGAFYYLALTNQFLTPFMPYIMMAAIGLLFLGAVVFIYYRVDWNNDEREGLRDIALGDSTSDKAKKLLEDVLVKPKRAFLPFTNLLKK